MDAKLLWPDNVHLRHTGHMPQVVTQAYIQAGFRKICIYYQEIFFSPFFVTLSCETNNQMLSASEPLLGESSTQVKQNEFSHLRHVGCASAAK